MATPISPPSGSGGASGIELRQYKPAQAKPPSNKLDQDAFLQLLTAQLRYQNPLDPVDGSEFVAQLATFSSLENMVRLNTNVENMLKLQQITQGSSLLGRRVTYAEADGQSVTGLAQELRIDGDRIELKVDNRFVALSQVRSIAA
jgi:flagellar basal-body rod modification protein FlgD